MALTKNFTTPHQVEATYHRLVRAEVDCTSQLMTLFVAVYASKEARAAGASPLWHEYPTVHFEDLKVDPRAAFYPMLAELQTGYLHGAEADEPVQHREPILALSTNETE